MIKQFSKAVHVIEYCFSYICKKFQKLSKEKLKGRIFNVRQLMKDKAFIRVMTVPQIEA